MMLIINCVQNILFPNLQMLQIYTLDYLTTEYLLTKTKPLIFIKIVINLHTRLTKYTVVLKIIVLHFSLQLLLPCVTNLCIYFT